jgi:putative hydrolase of the HAD superfamily
MSAVPEFVYFDLGKVLLGFSHEHACSQVAKVAGVPFEKVREFFTPEQSLNRLEKGQVSVAELYEEFCQTFACRPDMDQLSRAGSDIFCLNAEIVPLVAQLSAAGVRLGILSNTSEPHWQFVTDGRYRVVADFFEVHALSFEIGEMKPARLIYDKAAEMAGVAPERIFFTDDRPENVAGAVAAGWSAVQYTSTNALAAALRATGLKFNF